MLALLLLAPVVTFTHSIAPILYKHCAACHHPGEVAPFSLLTYQDAAKRAALIARVTASRFIGGSSYRPDKSMWYFPQARQLNQHGKYLLMAPCLDRSATIGFRCVIDAE